MNKTEFALKIKAKYPQYSDMDNIDLANKMIKKYPKEYKDITTTVGESLTLPLLKNLLKDINSAAEFTGGVGRAVVDAFTGNVKNPEPGGLQKVTQTSGELLNTTNEMTRPVIAPVVGLAQVPESLGGGLPEPIKNYIETGKKEAVSAVMNAPKMAFEHPGFTAAAFASLSPEASLLADVLKAAPKKIGKLDRVATIRKNIANYDTTLAPRVAEDLIKKEIAIHRNIEADLTAMNNYKPNGVNLTKTYDEVSKYVTANKEAKKLFSEIPELKEMIRGKQPLNGLTPLEAQNIKNEIGARTPGFNRIMEGKGNAKTIDSEALFNAIDDDITNGYPYWYPQVKKQYGMGYKATQELAALKNPADFKDFVLGKLPKGKNQTLQRMLSQILEPSLANEVLDYANTLNTIDNPKSVFKVSKLLQKQITPEKTENIVKRIVTDVEAPSPTVDIGGYLKDKPWVNRPLRKK